MANKDVNASEKEGQIQNLARSSQRFLSERPVVVLGSGATVPHGLPSMASLADELLFTIDGEPEGWKEFSRYLAKTKDLEQALHAVAVPEETLDLLVKRTWEIITYKDLAFYDQVLAGLSEFPLAALFKYLLRTVDAKVEVVTTNYDRLVEYAANSVDAYVSTGLTPGWVQKFLPTSVERARKSLPGFEGQVTLLKVHGSLDWFRDSRDEVYGIPFRGDVPQNFVPLIVTPGVSKYRQVLKDPFRTILTVSDSVLRSASSYVCIGYGFNDEHVQPTLIRRVLRENIPLVVLTKTLSQKARISFLSDPPKNFLFLEEKNGGTQFYNPEFPNGCHLADISVWELGQFMKLVSGERVR